MNLFNWQFMSVAATQLVTQDESVGSEGTRWEEEEKLTKWFAIRFDFIVCHVLLGLNVYTKSKTQKSDIKSFSDEWNVTEISTVKCVNVWIDS